MALFMPTNITPSTLGALGNGTVDATKALTVTWQVDGQNAMTAFEIKIMANTAESATLYDTGKLTNGCPFYGRDATGKTVFFSYTISAAALTQAGIANGSTYKLLITQWWSATESVTQQSASIFVCRAAPVLTITPYTTPVAQKKMTWTAAYSQAQGDAIIWVRWMLAQAANTEEPLHDTGNVATAQLAFTYDGLFTGQEYAIRCQVETVNGVTADTGWQTFQVEYTAAAYTGDVVTQVRADLSGVLVSWPGAYDIPGETEGEYNTADGKLTLAAGATLMWQQVKEKAMAFAPPWSAVWTGTLTALPVTLVTMTGDDGTTAALTLGADYCRMTTTQADGTASTQQVQAAFSVGDKVTAALTLEGLRLYRQYYIDGLNPAQSLYPGTGLFPRSGQNLSAVYTLPVTTAGEMTAASVKLTGAQVCDYFWMVSGALSSAELAALMSGAGYTPAWEERTLLLTNFSAGLNGGNVTTETSFAGWSIYRLKAGETLLFHVADTPYEQNAIVDCSVKSQETYTYYIFGTGQNVFATNGISSPPVTPILWDWTILAAEEDENGTYRVDDVFRFRYNVTSGTIGNNNIPNALNNYTRYPTVQMSPANYQSGKVSGYIGSVGKDGQYSDTISRRDAIYALSTTRKTLFLKNRKGDLLRIFLNGAVAMDTQDSTRQQAQIASAPWVETRGTDDARLVITKADGLWPVT